MYSKAFNPFASKEYHFLFWLTEHQTLVAGHSVVKFSQKELAAEYGSCETTVNRWLSTLRRAGCITSEKKGRYSITSRGHAVVAKMNEIEKALGGSQHAG